MLNVPTNPESWLAVPKIETGIQNMLRKKNMKFQHIDSKVEQSGITYEFTLKCLITKSQHHHLFQLNVVDVEKFSQMKKCQLCKQQCHVVLAKFQ